MNAVLRGTVPVAAAAAAAVIAALSMYEVPLAINRPPIDAMDGAQVQVQGTSLVQATGPPRLVPLPLSGPGSPLDGAQLA